MPRLAIGSRSALLGRGTEFPSPLQRRCLVPGVLVASQPQRSQMQGTVLPSSLFIGVYSFGCSPVVVQMYQAFSVLSNYFIFLEVALGAVLVASAMCRVAQAEDTLHRLSPRRGS